jgi:hypothetical protein
MFQHTLPFELLFHMPYRIDLMDVADVKPCLDPSLPEGHAFWVALLSRPQGAFFLSGME